MHICIYITTMSKLSQNNDQIIVWSLKLSILFARSRYTLTMTTDHHRLCLYSMRFTNLITCVYVRHIHHRTEIPRNCSTECNTSQYILSHYSIKLCYYTVSMASLSAFSTCVSIAICCGIQLYLLTNMIQFLLCSCSARRRRNGRKYEE